MFSYYKEYRHNKQKDSLKRGLHNSSNNLEKRTAMTEQIEWQCIRCIKANVCSQFMSGEAKVHKNGGPGSKL